MSCCFGAWILTEFQGDAIPIEKEPVQLAASIDGKHLFCLQIDGSVIIVDLKTDELFVRSIIPTWSYPSILEMNLPTATVNPTVIRWALTPDYTSPLAATWLVTEGMNDSVCVWNWRTGELRFPPIELASYVNLVVISRDERFLATARHANVDVFRFEDGIRYTQFPTGGTTDEIAFSGDSNRLVASTRESSVFVWDMGTESNSTR